MLRRSRPALNSRSSRTASAPPSSPKAIPASTIQSHSASYSRTIDAKAIPRKRVQPHWALGRWAKDRQKKDIVPGDLAATLDKHQKSNQETFFRWYQYKHEDGGRDRHDPDSPDSVVQGHDAQTPPRTIDDTRIRRTSSSEASARGSLTEKHEGQDPAESQAGVVIQEIFPETEAADGGLKVRKIDASFRPNKKGPPGYVPPTRYGREEKVPFYPFRRNTRNISRHERLSEDIRKLSQWLQLTTQEQTARLNLANELIDNIPSAVDGVSLSLMGSQSTGLADPLSDVDIKLNVTVLEEKASRGPSKGMGRPENRNLVKKKLAQVSKYLGHHGFTDHIIIAHANNPLLKVRHAASGLDFQIVFSQSTSSQEIVIRQLIDEHPHLKDVFMVLKAALAARRLNEPAIGGLGSYSLFMLVASGLKRDDVAAQSDTIYALKKVVQWWATTDTAEWCYDVGLKRYPKRTPIRGNLKQVEHYSEEYPVRHGMRLIQANTKAPPWALSLQDPDDPQNDLGRKAYLWREIQETLKVLYDHLERTVQGENIMARTQGHTQAPELLFLFGYNLARYQDQRNVFGNWIQKEGSKYNTAPRVRSDPRKAGEESPQLDEDGRKPLPEGRRKALEMYYSPAEGEHYARHES